MPPGGRIAAGVAGFNAVQKVLTNRVRDSVRGSVRGGDLDTATANVRRVFVRTSRPESEQQSRPLNWFYPVLIKQLLVPPMRPACA